MDSRPKKYLLNIILSIIIFMILSVLLSCVVVYPILKIYETIVGTEMPRTFVIMLIIFTFMIISAGFFVYLRKISNWFFVSIDNKNIYFGRNRQTKLPFNEILAIINGLPEKMSSTINANKYLQHGLWLYLVNKRKNSLLIVNKDYSIVQFNIHNNINGKQLMEMFINKNNEKFIINYEYDKEQIEVLKKIKPNQIQRSARIKNAFSCLKV